jgi:hypothetical protein
MAFDANLFDERLKRLGTLLFSLIIAWHEQNHRLKGLRGNFGRPRRQVLQLPDADVDYHEAVQCQWQSYKWKVDVKVFRPPPASED